MYYSNLLMLSQEYMGISLTLLLYDFHKSKIYSKKMKQKMI